MELELVEYIKTQLVNASKKIDSILDNAETETLTDKEKSELLMQKGRIWLLSEMIHDFKLFDQIDEEGILCGTYDEEEE